MPPMTTAASGTMRGVGGEPLRAAGTVGRGLPASSGNAAEFGNGTGGGVSSTMPGSVPKTVRRTRVGNRIEAMRKERRGMSGASHLCMLLTEIGNEYTMERHIAEVAQRTTPAEMVDWVKSRDDHLEDELRGRWKYARIYLLDNEDASSFDDKRHVITVYAIRNRRAEDRYETVLERFIDLCSARSP